MIARCELRHGRRRKQLNRWLLAVWFLSCTRLPAAPEPNPPDPDQSPPSSSPDPAPETGPPGQPLADVPSLAQPPGRPVEAPLTTDRPASPPGPIDTTPSEVDPSLEERFRTRRSLNHVLYRDRRYRLLLNEASAALRRGDALEAIDLLAEVSAAEEDVFVWEESSGRPISARRACARIVTGLPPHQRDCFERHRGAAASAQLEIARANRSSADLLAVVRRYPGTDSAAQAARSVAAQLLDCGRTVESAALWRQVLESTEWRELTPYEQRQVAYVAEQTNDATLAIHAAGVNEELNATGVRTDALTVKGRPGSRDALAGLAVRSRSPRHWTSPNGSVDGSRRESGTPPYYQPIWSAIPRLAESDDTSDSISSIQPPTGMMDTADRRDGNRSVVEWLRSRQENDEPVMTALSPVVVGEQVIVRQIQHVVARDLATGRVVWRHSCLTCLDGCEAQFAGENPAFNQTCAENALLGTISSDGQRLYLIDGLREVPIRGSASRG